MPKKRNLSKSTDVAAILESDRIRPDKVDPVYWCLATLLNLKQQEIERLTTISQPSLSQIARGAAPSLTHEDLLMAALEKCRNHLQTIKSRDPQFTKLNDARIAYIEHVLNGEPL